MDKFARISVIDGFERNFLSNLNILVIGAGAIGNEVIKNLALFGIGSVTIVDFDTIEIHNLTRSIFFRENDVGKNKADIVATRASDVSKETVFTSINGDFWASISIEELQKFDGIICAVDNFEARIRINTLAKLSNTLMINTGIDHRFVSVETFPFNLDDECACYECSIPATVYEKISARYSCGWIKKIYQEKQVIPTTSITASAVGSLAVSQLFQCLQFTQDRIADHSIYSTRILYDTRGVTISKSQLKRKLTCPSPTHRDKELRYTKASRKFHTEKNIFAQLSSNLSKSYVEFSEPLLLTTRLDDKVHETFFQIAENFDERILMQKGERTLDAEISWGMPFNELTENFSDYVIPCKYVTIIDDELRFDILMELTDAN